MAVAYDNQVSAAASAATTVTTGSFTISATANRVAVISAKFESSGSVTSVTSTCGGTSGSAVSGADIATQGGDVRVTQYKVIAPSSGSQTASLSWTTSSYCTIEASTYTGADQSTGVNGGNAANAGFGTNAPVTITSTSGDMAVSLAANTSGTGISGDQTQLFNDTQTRVDRNTGGGSTTFGWSNGGVAYMASAGCNVMAASAAAANILVHPGMTAKFRDLRGGLNG